MCDVKTQKLLLPVLFFRLFSDAGIYDRIVVQELIKNMAQVQQLERDAQREFKGGFAYRSYLQLTACCG